MLWKIQTANQFGAYSLSENFQTMRSALDRAFELFLASGFTDDFDILGIAESGMVIKAGHLGTAH